MTNKQDVVIDSIKRLQFTKDELMQLASMVNQLVVTDVVSTPRYLYHLSSSKRGYDTYQGAVVVAESAEQAKLIHPSWWVCDHARIVNFLLNGEKIYDNGYDCWKSDSWVNSPDEVEVTLIGTTNEPVGTIILTDFNAG